MLRAASALLTVALGLSAAGCSDDEADGTSTPVGVEVTTAADCAETIPDAVPEALGWDLGTGATYSVRGCERRSERGYVQVRDLAGDLAERCEGFGEQAVTWLDDLEACADEPDADIGLTKVVVAGDEGELTQIWVAALETTDQERVRAAVALVAERV